MKKIASTFILSLVLLSIIVTQLIIISEANPFPQVSQIIIQSPNNQTYYKNSLALNVTIITKFDGLYESSSKRVVNYSLDNQATIPLKEQSFQYNNESESSIFFSSTTLTDLNEGSHTLKVQSTYYYLTEVNIAGTKYITQSHYAVKYVNFTVDTKPLTISILNPINNTVFTVTNLENVSFPLTIKTDESTSWLGYSIDGQGTINIVGNMTLSGFSAGSHNLVVYAKDELGNTSTSETVTFTISKQESFPTITFIASIGVVVIVGVSSIYFRKHKHQK
jgi:hypothetical protein